MRLKRIFAPVLALLLAFSFVLPAAAENAGERFTVPETTFSFEVPAGTVLLRPGLDSDAAAWAAAGVLDVSDKRTEMIKDSIAAEIHVPESGRVIAVMEKRSPNFSEYIYNLKDADEEMREQVETRLTPNNDVENSGGGFRWVEHPVTPFFCVDIFSDMTTMMTGEPEIVYERIYGTIVNGGLITFDLYPTSDPVDEETDAVLQALVSSVEVSEFYPRPEFRLTPETVIPLALLLFLVAFLIGFIVYRIIAGRREKRQKKEFADRLAAYRQQKGESDEGDGALRFVNETDHSDAAVKQYANYRSYRAGLFIPLTSILLSLVALYFIWTIGDTDNWWMALLLIACVVFCVYRLATAGSTLTRNLNRMYSKFRSRKATYYFYDGDFRITGMQASNLYPYFQITKLVENGPYFYLFFGADNAYYLRKENFSVGTEEEFRKFMREKLGKRAKI